MYIDFVLQNILKQFNDFFLLKQSQYPILMNILKYFIDLFIKQSQYATLINILKYSIDLFSLKQISIEVC